jgi:hypothetical protein
MAYAAGWKKFEPAWDLVIRAKRASGMLPALEQVLGGFGRHSGDVVGDNAPTAAASQRTSAIR